MYEIDTSLLLRDFRSCGAVRKRRQILSLLSNLFLVSLDLSCREIAGPSRLKKTLDAATVVAEGSCALLKVSAPQFTELRERIKRGLDEEKRAGLKEEETLPRRFG